MKRTTLSIAMGLGLITLTASAFSGDWTFMPIRDAAYKADTTLSLAGGTLSGTPAGSGSYTGVELAFNCLALQPPSGVIRSKVSYGEFNHNGLKLSSFEVNPRWTTKLSDNLSFGIGPGIGYVQAKSLGVSTGMGAVQIGADLDYRVGALNLGLGARWQNTGNKYIAPGINGANNSLVQAKLGINF